MAQLSGQLSSFFRGAWRQQQSSLCCVTSGRKVPGVDMPRLAGSVYLTRKQLSPCCSQRLVLPGPHWLLDPVSRTRLCSFLGKCLRVDLIG